MSNKNKNTDTVAASAAAQALAVVNKRYGKRDPKIASHQGECGVKGANEANVEANAAACAGVSPHTLSRIRKTGTGVHLTTQKGNGVKMERRRKTASAAKTKQRQRLTTGELRAMAIDT